MTHAASPFRRAEAHPSDDISPYGRPQHADADAHLSDDISPYGRAPHADADADTETLPVVPGFSDISEESDESDLLANPALDDDLNDRISKAAPRRLANRATYVLAGLALVVIGFVGGAQVQKSYGTAPAATVPGGANPAALASAFANRGSGQGFPGGGNGTGGGGTRSGVTGTVKLVDGTTVYIETPDGATVIVKTSDKTTVSTPGALKDLTAGATVTVQGQTADGSVTATSITKTK
ncbi:hypothetical protein [Dactylosporangium sp. NPDC051484]|uniref:hypothetical protein n=1 Tax=Dactylosporangium sp. NPDC051484 TaxID=3154942 RepID=UPI00344F0376